MCYSILAPVSEGNQQQMENIFSCFFISMVLEFRKVVGILLFSNS
uniref:Uncharacterized protein n=1 Tax=Rhizophora mucronata TaxID=61149 RepID=A0A2P2P9T2_RHIMU